VVGLETLKRYNPGLKRKRKSVRNFSLDKAGVQAYVLAWYMYTAFWKTKALSGL